jgi:hypothetical protein
VTIRRVSGQVQLTVPNHVLVVETRVSGGA